MAVVEGGTSGWDTAGTLGHDPAVVESGAGSHWCSAPPPAQEYRIQSGDTATLTQTTTSEVSNSPETTTAVTD